MKHTLKIYLIFAILYSVLPYSELYEPSETSAVSHNCCNDDTQNGKAQNSCTSLCNCFNNFPLINFIPADIFLDVIFIHNLTNTKSYIEGQTKRIFRPPEV